MAEFWTPKQLAERWGLHPKTVRGLCASGKLRGLRVGDQWRVSQAALDAFEDQNTSRPEKPAAQATTEPIQRQGPAPLRRAAELSGGYTPVFKGPVPWRAEVIK